MRLSYPRFAQAIARLDEGAAVGGGTAAAALGALVVMSELPVILAAGPMLVATLRARDAWLARRQYRQATIGFASERLVARKLDELGSEGWTTRHSLGWRGHGDIDHVVIAPCGVAFAIETKTKTVDWSHVDRTDLAAREVDRRRGVPGCVPVIAVVRGCDEVVGRGTAIIVPVDRLSTVLRRRAGEVGNHPPARP